MIVDKKDVILKKGYVIVIPSRAYSEIIRTEKKYDRHFMGIVAVGDSFFDKNSNVMIDEGDIVFYDDSNAIETTMLVNGVSEKVEIISVDNIFGIKKK